MAQTQSSTEPTAHNVDEGRRSLDVEGMAANIWGTTDRNEDPRSNGAEQQIAGTGDPGDVAVTSVAGGAREPEDWADGGETEDRGNAKGRKEPAAAIGEKGRSIADGQYAHGISGATTDQGGVGGTREPNGVTRQRVPGGAKMELTGRDGTRETETGGRAAESSCSGAAWLHDLRLDIPAGHLQRWRRAESF